MIDRRITGTRAALGVLGATALLALGVGAAPASAQSAWWQLGFTSAPTNLPPGGKAAVYASATNVGDGEASGANVPITVADQLPAGLEVTNVFAYAGPQRANSVRTPSVLSCTQVLQRIACPYDGTLAPYEGITLEISVKVAASLGTEATLSDEVRVEGGETTSASITRPLKVSGEETPFGLERYEMTAENEGGSIDTQAGSHPYQLTTTFNLNQRFTVQYPFGHKQTLPSAPALLKNAQFTLPPGLVGDTTAVPRCSGVDFATIMVGPINLCPADTAVGVANVSIDEPTFLGVDRASVPVFNLVPEPGEPARFGFVIDGVPVVLSTSLATGSDYAVVVTVHDASEAASVLTSQVSFWGVPGASSHDSSRGWQCLDKGYWDEAEPCTPPGEAQTKPLLILPTSCERQASSSVEAEAWTGEKLKGAFSFPYEFDGCNLLRLTPSMGVEPEIHEASTPTGMTIEVHVPQESTLSASGLAEADARDTTLKLPVGVQASPAAAVGLFACSAADVGFLGSFESAGEINPLQNEEFSPGAAACPPPSVIGTVSIKTPLLEHELQGFLYLGEQDTNPFRSPLVAYLVAEDKTKPSSGVRVKLVGQVKLEEETGQLVTTFEQTPPLPFEDLTVHLLGGPNASQATPAKCGRYTTTASFTPWFAGPPAQASSSFTIDSGPHGSPCVYEPGALPFAPSFVAGSTNAQAGAFTPFTLTIEKPDGQQALQSITASLPPGVAAQIANVTPCPDPQALEAMPTLSSTPPPCGRESLIGHTVSVSGLGGDPVTLEGELFLTTGIDGAPFGLLASTEAKAGPFDLGYVNVLSTVTVNETTAAVTTRTVKPIPSILDGVPVQLKQINVTVERPGDAPFEFNPTNCSPMSVAGTLTGDEGASDAVSTPFQAVNCTSLPFAPKLTASVVGQASKVDGAAFTVKIESPGLGQANIHKVDLTLPEALPSRQSTIEKACLEKVFDANPASCDEGSVIGEGIVHTPVFKNPLRGPAYLVSHGAAAFPDVEFVLQGEGVKLVVDGQTDIKHGVTYSKFESAPDAPFTTFESIFPAGPHSALTAYVPEKEDFNLCKTSLSIPTEITAQNGAVITQTTPVAVTGCGGVAAFKETRAQKLAKALAACHTKYKASSKKAKRLACETAARKKYGSNAKKSSRARKSSARR